MRNIVRAAPKLERRVGDVFWRYEPLTGPLELVIEEPSGVDDTCA
jgi:hypothetical protein